LNPGIEDAVKVTFESGFINMCSISVVPAGAGGGGPEFHVPFSAPAIEFAAFYSPSPPFYGNCSEGLVDGQQTEDAICNARGADCNIGWTEAGEYVEYEFLAILDMVDIMVRVASMNPSRTVTLSMYNAETGLKFAEQTFNTPGLGWQVFEDVVWVDASVIFVNHVKLRVKFDTGKVNMCAVSVLPK